MTGAGRHTPLLQPTLQQYLEAVPMPTAGEADEAVKLALECRSGLAGIR